MIAMKSLFGRTFEASRTPFYGSNDGEEVFTSAHLASLLPADRQTDQIAA